MRYVALVHKEPNTAYGVSLPDVPGCFSAGHTLEEALRNAAEAVLLHTEGQPLPQARAVEDVLADPEWQDVLPDALIASVDVDPAELELLPVDTSLLDAIDAAAGRQGISRRDFVERTLRAALERA